MVKFDHLIKLILIVLLVFTPLAWGAMDLWASSVMELGILLIIVLWGVQLMTGSPSGYGRTPGTRRAVVDEQWIFPAALLTVFVGLVIFQMTNLPSMLIQIVSPKTVELRNQLQVSDQQLSRVTLSFLPHATKLELFKWLALTGLFFFLLSWKLSEDGYRVTGQLIWVLLLIGCLESLYGLYSAFGRGRGFAGGTFVNRNHFAGYLLMIIPLTVGYLFSREASQRRRFSSWVSRLTSLDGRGILIGFGVILMILGLLFSASRMGISSLLISFTLIIMTLRSRKGERWFSKKSALILGLAVLWGAWIGLDAVISRFFTTSEDFGKRWQIWADTSQIIKDFPLFGAGLGTFAQIFPMHRSFHIRGLVSHAENDFLQLASDTGLIGLGLLLAVFVYLFFKAATRVRALSEGEPQRYIAIGGLVGILAIMFHSLVERNIQVPANALLYTVLWAIVLATTCKTESTERIGHRA
jgi:O-antigen ligase